MKTGDDDLDLILEAALDLHAEGKPEAAQAVLRGETENAERPSSKETEED